MAQCDICRSVSAKVTAVLCSLVYFFNVTCTFVAAALIFAYIAIVMLWHAVFILLLTSFIPRNSPVLSCADSTEAL